METLMQFFIDWIKKENAHECYRKEFTPQEMENIRRYETTEFNRKKLGIDNFDKWFITELKERIRHELNLDVVVILENNHMNFNSLIITVRRVSGKSGYK